MKQCPITSSVPSCLKLLPSYFLVIPNSQLRAVRNHSYTGKITCVGFKADIFHDFRGGGLLCETLRERYALVYQQHQSQTLLTSREVPADLVDIRYEGAEPDSELVYIERISGVATVAGVEILRQRQLKDSVPDLQWISERVEGHVFLLTQLAAIGKGKPGYLRKHPELVTKKAEPILREQLARQSEAARDLLSRMCVLRVGIDIRGLTIEIINILFMSKYLILIT
ncbi:MAG: hypothetical protein V7K64_33355 [Nostoc sp.]